MQQLDENALKIYTDGSCFPSPRVGGVGYLFVTVDDDGNEVIHEESLSDGRPPPIIKWSSRRASTP